MSDMTCANNKFEYENLDDTRKRMIIMLVDSLIDKFKGVYKFTMFDKYIYSYTAYEIYLIIKDLKIINRDFLNKCNMILTRIKDTTYYDYEYKQHYEFKLLVYEIIDLYKTFYCSHILSTIN